MCFARHAFLSEESQVSLRRLRGEIYFGLNEEEGGIYLNRLLTAISQDRLFLVRSRRQEDKQNRVGAPMMWGFA